MLEAPQPEHHRESVSLRNTESDNFSRNETYNKTFNGEIQKTTPSFNPEKNYISNDDHRSQSGGSKMSSKGENTENKDKDSNSLYKSKMS